METALKRRHWIILALTAAILVVGLIVGIDRFTPSNSESQTAAVAARDSRRDFSLTDTSGEKVSLATYQGKWLLLFFGFTYCPDICPTTMLNMSATLKTMGEAAKNVQPIFITIDPERDTPGALKEYLANFGDNIVGLSGTPDEIAAVAKGYGIYYQKRPLDDGSYTMDHSTAVYLVSPEGAYVRPYLPDVEPDEFAKQLLAAMSATP